MLSIRLEMYEEYFTFFHFQFFLADYVMWLNFEFLARVILCHFVPFATTTNDFAIITIILLVVANGGLKELIIPKYYR